MRYLFRKGLEVNYRSRYVHLSWARFERDEGNVDNARELFRRGHTLNPQDAPLLQAWAVMEHKEGKIDVARQLFEAGSRADPHHLHIWQVRCPRTHCLFRPICQSTAQTQVNLLPRHASDGAAWHASETPLTGGCTSAGSSAQLCQHCAAQLDESVKVDACMPA